MCNILDYIRTYGNETFLERHFSSADALVLAQLSYMDWTGKVPQIKDNQKFVTLKEILYSGDLETMIRGSVFKENNRALFYQAANSQRFGTIQLNYYAEVWNAERNLQMSALTFLLPCNRACVTFRGTDGSLNGWKESFSMVYRFPIPAQEYASMYLKKVAGYMDCPLIVCGHSKGGNLAVYAAADCGAEVQNRINRVYNFDGPGFWPEFLKEERYCRIAPRIRKYVAPESFIGLLLKDSSKSFMVECNSHGMRQHDPYQWELFHGRIRKVGRYNKEKRKAGEHLNSSILAVSKEKARGVIESFFKVATDSGVKKLSELNGDYVLEVFKNFRRNRQYDRKSAVVLAKLLLYLLPGRKILR